MYDDVSTCTLIVHVKVVMCNMLALLFELCDMYCTVKTHGEKNTLTRLQTKSR